MTRQQERYTSYFDDGSTEDDSASEAVSSLSSGPFSRRSIGKNSREHDKSTGLGASSGTSSDGLSSLPDSALAEWDPTGEYRQDRPSSLADAMKQYEGVAYLYGPSTGVEGQSVSSYGGSGHSAADSSFAQYPKDSLVPDPGDAYSSRQTGLHRYQHPPYPDDDESFSARSTPDSAPNTGNEPPYPPDTPPWGQGAPYPDDSPTTTPSSSIASQSGKYQASKSALSSSSSVGGVSARTAPYPEDSNWFPPSHQVSAPQLSVSRHSSMTAARSSNALSSSFSSGISSNASSTGLPIHAPKPIRPAPLLSNAALNNDGSAYESYVWHGGPDLSRDLSCGPDDPSTYHVANDARGWMHKLRGNIGRDAPLRTRGGTR
jgi:hypothetical protein